MWCDDDVHAKWAMSSVDEWIYPRSSFRAAFAFAGMGVIAGLLINRNLWKEEKEDASENFARSWGKI